MNQQLEPGRVDMADIADWIRQGKALVHRRIGLFIALTAAHVLISLATRHMGYLTMPLGLLITQGCLILLLQAARNADDSVPFSIAQSLALLQRLTAYCLVIAVVCSLFVLAALLFGTWFAPALPVRDYSESPVFLSIDWLAPGVVRFFFLYATTTITGAWFLLPVLTYLPLTLKESFVLSRRAERKSAVVMMAVGYSPLFAFVLLLLVTEASLIAGTIFLPYFAAVQYVAFRQVFLQRKSNSPARVVAVAAATAESLGS